MTDDHDARSQQLLHLLAENTNDVVWTMSPAGDITYVSPSVERMRGITPEEAMRQALDQIHPPESAAISAGYFQDLYAALAEGRHPPDNFRAEVEYYCADGSTVWAELQVMPRYDDHGGLAEIVGVSRDISERRAQEDALREARLEAERERAVTAERERMARELHDELIQVLSAVGLGIATAEMRADDEGRTRELLSRLRDDLSHAIETSRGMVAGLRDRLLEGRDLADVLRALLDDVAERSGMECELDIRAWDPGSQSRDTDEVLYRVAREALTNAVRHSGGTAIRVSLASDPAGTTLVVADNGTGVASGMPVRADAYGIVGMRERATAVGGTFSIEPAVVGGATVTVRVPAAGQASASPRDDR